jgi:hypothetical protein
VVATPIADHSTSTPSATLAGDREDGRHHRVVGVPGGDRDDAGRHDDGEGVGGEAFAARPAARSTGCHTSSVTCPTPRVAQISATSDGRTVGQLAMRTTVWVVAPRSDALSALTRASRGR